MSNERYINPYTDFGFKKLFGTEMNKDLLISFLNALFQGEKSEITDIQYLNGENLGDGYGDRRAIFDVYCTSVDGSRFILKNLTATPPVESLLRSSRNTSRTGAFTTAPPPSASKPPRERGTITSMRCIPSEC